MAEVAERQHICIQITRRWRNTTRSCEGIQSTNVPEDLSSAIIEDEGSGSEVGLSSTQVSFPTAVENVVKSHSGSRIRDA